MSQGVTIKGKTATGQSVEIRVDESGQLVNAASPVRITKFDPSETTPTYIGTNPSSTALDTDTTWTVLKFTRNGSNEVTLVQTATGAWSDRAILSY